MNSQVRCPKARVGSCHLDRTKAFRGIEKKSQGAEHRGFARDVGCADVAASTPPDVFAAKDTDEKIAERNRAEQIGGDEGED